MSTCAMIQPPKMSPCWFASAGIGMTRNAGCFPSGSFSMHEVVKRTTPERREAGAEDEPGVGEVGVGDDSLVHRRLRFLQVRIDQRVDERLVDRIGLALHRSAVDPAVDSLAGFPAQLAELDLAGEDPGHLRGA